MERTRNEALAAWMLEHQVTANELADRVNSAIAEFTGSYGTCTERGVFRWLSGEITSPHARQRVALERVTGRTSLQLGFRPRARQPGPAPVSPEEDPVYRRAFLAAATAAGVSATSPGEGPPRRVGMADVACLNTELTNLVTADNRHGGTAAHEQRAVDLARQTLEIQRHGAASQRVRGHLYATAAAFTSSAMWAAIDGRRLDSAQEHLYRAVTLAGLSGDPAAQFRIWSHAGILYRHLGRPTDAEAAGEAARSTSIARRDPLYLSLAHARVAVAHADAGEATTALRSLGHAQDALNRADPALPRPPWLDFYDQAEWESLAVTVHLGLGRWAEAEAHAHRGLALLRPHLVRNRAMVGAQLARAQLKGGAVESAVATALAIPTDMARSSGRLRGLLDGFGSRLEAVAPHTPEARAWADHIRSLRRTTA
ncbi:Tat pathway signal protein [Streptomyces sp. NPDC005962]|uniref:Tat pathway signal protein n=1 Tax=Streptomyces sp. NPDC005962 TaxID=3154466 RepID=UPI0033D22282